jgi:hypothetical protein
MSAQIRCARCGATATAVVAGGSWALVTFRGHGWRVCSAACARAVLYGLVKGDGPWGLAPRPGPAETEPPFETEPADAGTGAGSDPGPVAVR